MGPSLHHWPVALGPFRSLPGAAAAHTLSSHGSEVSLRLPGLTPSSFFVAKTWQREERSPQARAGTGREEGSGESFADGLPGLGEAAGDRRESGDTW